MKDAVQAHEIKVLLDRTPIGEYLHLEIMPLRHQLATLDPRSRLDQLMADCRRRRIDAVVGYRAVFPAILDFCARVLAIQIQQAHDE